MVKGQSGITSYGYNDQSDNLTRQLVPFQVAHFPLTIGVTTLLADRSGLDWSTDEDGDGRNETVNAKFYQTVLAMESLTVPAGTFSRTLRIETKAVFVVSFTKGGSGTAIQTNTAWHAPGVGKVKEIIDVRIEGNPLQTTLTEELIGYVVNGQGSGLRIQLDPESGLPPITMTLGATKTFRASLYDQENRLIVGVPFSWHSSNDSIVTVDENGIATGASPGTASVTAALGNIVSNGQPVTIIDLRLVAMYTRDIAYDPVSNRIYASVSDNSGSLSNTVAAIIPDTGTVEWSAAVGPTPGKLTISDNGQYLYVAVNDGKVVVKVNLSTRGIQQSFPLGNYAVLDMVALGGSPDSLVIARQKVVPGIPGGVAVYDGGVPRPFATPGWGESEARDNIPTILERSSSNSIVYGTGHANIFTISIGASGATITSTQPITIDVREMVFSDGLLYFPSGEVYSPLTSSLQGSYPVPPINNLLNKVLPYPSLNKVFFAQFFSAYEWLAFDRTTFAPAGSVNIYNVGTGSPLRFIPWGSNGLALSTDAGQVFIFRSTLFQ